MLVITWITYATRTFVFTLCPTKAPICTRNQYINDPGDAIAHGEDPSDILFVNDTGDLYYRRVRSDPGCIPLARNQLVKIAYPQHCEFKNSSGVSYDGKSVVNGLYSFQDGNNTEYYVTTGESCAVKDGGDAGIVSGKALAEWDSSI